MCIQDSSHKGNSVWNVLGRLWQEVISLSLVNNTRDKGFRESREIHMPSSGNIPITKSNIPQDNWCTGLKFCPCYWVSSVCHARSMVHPSPPSSVPQEADLHGLQAPAPFPLVVFGDGRVAAGA